MARVGREEPGEPGKSRLDSRGPGPTPRDYVRATAPGLVAGAADTDPTTVATLAVLGAATVYGLAWLVVLLFPLLAVIQVIAARVGQVSRSDLQSCVGRLYGRPLRLVLLLSVLVVNIVTIAADLEAGAAALALLTGIGYAWYLVPLAALLLGLLLLGSFSQVQRVLRFVLLGLLAYGVAAVLAHPDWWAVLGSTFVPRFRWSSNWTAGALALLGTTMTSYVYIWQTIEESEDQVPSNWLRTREVGAATGIGFGVVLFWFILVSTGATLGVHHRTVVTARDAAAALQPVAGRYAADVFAVGLLASALVALPVLMATTAYVVGAEFSWTRGLSQPVRGAGRFYAAIGTSVALGGLIAASGISPIRILFIASVAGGIATPVGMVCLLLVARDRRVMGPSRVSAGLAAGGWCTVAIVVVAGVSFIARALGIP